MKYILRESGGYPKPVRETTFLGNEPFIGKDGSVQTRIVRLGSSVRYLAPRRQVAAPRPQRGLLPSYIFESGFSNTIFAECLQKASEQGGQGSRR